jgi:glyoxylase-like metal-dependent hydrolase (beta-lactamase superfamily II)
MVGEAEVPATPRVPDGGLLAGEETIDGVAFAYEVFNDAEAPEQVVVRLPESGVVIVQDYVYNNAHFFPLGNIPNWIAQLEAMRGLSADGYRTLLPGHGLPTSLGEIDIAIEYLTLLDETLQASDSAEAVIAAMSAAYPGFEGAGILGFAASLYTQG